MTTFDSIFGTETEVAVPTTIVKDRVYVQRAGFKPFGLWVSVVDGWAEWCRGEEFRLHTLTHVQPIAIRPDAEIIVLDSAAALDRFTVEFGDGDPAYGYIDWPKVSTTAQGIIIAPYQWSRRLDLMWYYGWDCASGCLWDLHCLADDVAPEDVDSRPDDEDHVAQPALMRTHAPGTRSV